MLSHTVEYALRAMVTLAGDTKARTAQEIAKSSRVPLDYLSKVLNSLTRAGLLTAQRGRGGGFVAARPADRITVLDVVSAVDPVQRIKTCPLGLAAHGTNLCSLHRKLDDVARCVEEAFAETTLESLVAPASGTDATICRLEPLVGLCEGGKHDAATAHCLS